MTTAITARVVGSNPATGFTITSRLERMFYSKNSEGPLINSDVEVKTVLITIILTVMVTIIIIIAMLLLVSNYKCRNYFRYVLP